MANEILYKNSSGTILKNLNNQLLFNEPVVPPTDITDYDGNVYTEIVLKK